MGRPADRRLTEQLAPCQSGRRSRSQTQHQEREKEAPGHGP